LIVTSHAQRKTKHSPFERVGKKRKEFPRREEGEPPRRRIHRTKIRNEIQRVPSPRKKGAWNQDRILRGEHNGGVPKYVIQAGEGFADEGLPNIKKGKMCRKMAQLPQQIKCGKNRTTTGLDHSKQKIE